MGMILVFIFAFFMNFSVYSSAGSLFDVCGQDLLVPERREIRSRPLQIDDKLSPVFPNVPFDAAALRKALDDNDKFHKFGGALKSVQLFRDSAIDDTLRKLELEFVPNGDEKGVTDLRRHLKEYYDANYDSRGGYGRPLPGRFRHSSPGGETKDSLVSLFEKRWIEPIEDSTGQKKWDASLGPIGPECPNLVQLGTTESDGYKFFCPSNAANKETTPSTMTRQRRLGEAEQEQLEMVSNSIKQLNDVPCHILSVGGNDNWKFEAAAADTLGCITHTFDCTLPGNQPKRKPVRDDVRFYPHCLDGHTHKDAHGRSYITYQGMLELAGITKSPPAYFKIDVEGFEYDIFSQMIQQDQETHGADGKMSLLPQQIQVELHWATRMTGVEWMPRTRSSGEIALFSSMMYQGGGYLPIHLDFNPHCTTCMEVLYYKTIC